MLNTVELEKKWLKYKIKSYLPYITMIISIVIISILIWILLKDNTQTVSKKQIKENINNSTLQIKHPEVIQEKVLTTDKKIVKIKTPIHTVLPTHNRVLKPSFTFINDIQDTVQINTADYTPIVYHKPQPKQQQKIKKEILKPIPSVTTNHTSIVIKSIDTQKDIDSIISRFKSNNSPALSLFIAKKYYAMGDYHKAYNYALITNSIDNTIDSSWIVFTKSLVKLHKKDKAISILQKYINSSHSNSAQLLLGEIQSGKFQ